MVPVRIPEGGGGTKTSVRNGKKTSSFREGSSSWWHSGVGDLAAKES